MTPRMMKMNTETLKRKSCENFSSRTHVWVVFQFREDSFPMPATWRLFVWDEWKAGRLTVATLTNCHRVFQFFPSFPPCVAAAAVEVGQFSRGLQQRTIKTRKKKSADGDSGAVTCQQRKPKRWKSYDDFAGEWPDRHR